MKVAKKVKGVDMVKQFKEDDFNRLYDNGLYWFEKEMISACHPLFDEAQDNHDVEDELVKAKVIDKNCIADSECSALVVQFKTPASAKSFIRRLNKYLAKRSKA